jgi:hypothetical protein
MIYPPEFMAKVKVFWRDFDNRYNGDEGIQIMSDCNLFINNPNGTIIPNLEWMFHSLKYNIRTDPANYEQLFLKDVKRYEEGITALANDQQEIIDKHDLHNDEFRQALELFGQGLVYDEKEKRVHKMDGNTPKDYIGYSRWHGFARAAISLGLDYEFWLNLDRSIFLGLLIQSELNPLNIPNNQAMSDQRLSELRNTCGLLDIEKLDKSFNNYFQ